MTGFTITLNPDGTPRTHDEIIGALLAFRPRERTPYEATLELQLEREVAAYANRESDLIGDRWGAERREAEIREAATFALAALDDGDPAAARTLLREALDRWGPF